MDPTPSMAPKCSKWTEELENVITKASTKILLTQIYLIGGFEDKAATAVKNNADRIYEYVPNSHFREVARSDLKVGGAMVVQVPQYGMDFA